MRVRTSRLALATAIAGTAALTLGLSGSAHAAPADTGARSGDIVGVGSDTLQNLSDFLFDAGSNGATGGFNSIGNVNRIFNIFATGDANGRATYDGTTNSTTGLPNVLGGTVVLRAGDDPVARPNGSGPGIAALVLDAPGAAGYQGLPNGSIQFARASRLPKETAGDGEGNTCAANTSGCGGLHIFQAATDVTQIAHLASGSDAPAGGLSAADLLNIYECKTTTWNALPGNASGSTNTIIPNIPQAGSGTRAAFVAALQTVDPTFSDPASFGGCVKSVQEHDPDGIVNSASPKDTIEPFSQGKLAVINNGYFNATGNAAFKPGTLANFPAGNTADGNTAATFQGARGLYYVIRQADLASTTPFEPGSSLNWAETLFEGDPNNANYVPYIERSSNQALIKAAGFTPAYKDCGVGATSC